MLTVCATGHPGITWDSAQWPQDRRPCPYCWAMQLVEHEARKELRRGELLCGLGNTL